MKKSSISVPAQKGGRRAPAPLHLQSNLLWKGDFLASCAKLVLCSYYLGFLCLVFTFREVTLPVLIYKIITVFYDSA